MIDLSIARGYRVRILSFFSIVDSINNPDLVDPPTLEIVKESLRRFEDTIDIDIKDRMVKEISQFIEVHFMDDVIRQVRDITSLNDYFIRHLFCFWTRNGRQTVHTAGISELRPECYLLSL